ncbi:ThiF family adenylyltransferase, partial [Candidatus Bipolaricaulota bacterium]|nr:ThiF family adenylyltransferase [Candidatus Bipolaricaulota bacterium]
MSEEPSSSKRIRSTRFRSPYLRPKEELEDPITDRQQKVTGFDQGALEELHVTLVGAGGLGTEIGEGLVRKGVGSLDIIDHDTVKLSNLNRQKFYEDDIYCNKARALAH